MAEDIGKLSPNLPIFCDSCQVDLATVELAEIHIKGKKHNGRFWKIPRKNPAVFLPDCKSFGTADILTHFAKFGVIRDIRGFKAKKLANEKTEEFIRMRIEFDDPQIVDKILKMRHLIKNRSIRVARSIEKAPSCTFLTETEIGQIVQKISHDQVKAELKGIEDPEEQMEALMKLLELKANDIEQRTTIANHIQRTVSDVFPNCVVYLFGSTVNGLGFVGCDIDAYLDLGTEKNAGGEMRSVAREAMQSRARAIASKLKESRLNGIIANVQGIYQARVPIVKFVHIKSGLSCDLSLKNKMAVLNTEFIRLCIEADARVRTLMVTIRYWASKLGISGGGKGSRSLKITNYALTLLVIFYLQVEGILPSAMTLQGLAKVGDKCIIDGWQCGFCTDLSLWPLQPKPKCGMDLLRGFFAFYGEKFNYGTHVVSPFAGIPVEKSKFVKKVEHDEESYMKTYWENVLLSSTGAEKSQDEQLLHVEASLCVQDPFELNLCVTKGYLPQALAKWKQSCDQTAKLLSREKDFTSLLDIFELDSSQSLKGSKLLTKKKKAAAINPNESNVCFEVPFHGQTEDKEAFMARVKSILHQIAKCIFKMQTVPVSSMADNDKCPHHEVGKEDPQAKLLAGLKAEPQKEGQWATLCCSVIYHAFHSKSKREAVRKELNLGPQISVESESAIFEHIFTQQYGGLKAETNLAGLLQPDCVFDMSTHWSTVDNEVCVHLSLSRSRKKAWKGIFTYLRDYIPAILDSELRLLGKNVH